MVTIPSLFASNDEKMWATDDSLTYSETYIPMRSNGIIKYITNLYLNSIINFCLASYSIPFANKNIVRKGLISKLICARYVSNFTRRLYTLTYSVMLYFTKLIGTLSYRLYTFRGKKDAK